MVHNNILQKVMFLLTCAKAKTVSTDDYQLILSYVTQHSNHLVLGKVFGYSISDYAIATLYWIQTNESLEDFDSVFSKLVEGRKNLVNELIERELYLEI